MTDFESIDIFELLPQKEPFVMVDKLIHFDMDRTLTRTSVREGNLFVDNGVFSESGIMENIAQTCAVRIGYINKYILKKDIRLGFIGAIRNLEIFRLPNTGETIETEILTIEEVFGMTLIKALVKLVGDVNSGFSGAGCVICEAEMKIALSEKKAEAI